MASELTGAWELVNDDFGGMVFYSETHYAFMNVDKSREAPSTPRAEFTDAEAAGQFRTFASSSGTYEVSGSSIVRRPVVALAQVQADTESKIEFAIEGDQLTEVVTFGGQQDPATFVYRRVS